jgi:phosphatidylserine/phosphatidylglycerophosphate/cardiolipin synthase-like enzyme
MDFIRRARPISAQLVAGRGHYEGVVQAVLNAEQSVWIATANLKELMVEDHRAPLAERASLARPRAANSYRSVLALFDELVSKGVEIRILHASAPSRPFALELRRNGHLTGKVRMGRRGGFEMRTCPRVHVKAVIIDGAMIYLGSANWTGAGLGAKGEGRRNFEVGFMSRDDLLLDEMQSYYDQIWQGRPCVSCKMREECPAPLDERVSPAPIGSPAPIVRPARVVNVRPRRSV